MSSDTVPLTCPKIISHELFAILAPESLALNKYAADLFADGYEGKRALRLGDVDAEMQRHLSDGNYDDPEKASARFEAYNVIQHVSEMLENCKPIVDDTRPISVSSGSKKTNEATVTFAKFRDVNCSVARFKPVIVATTQRLYSRNTDQKNSVFFGEVWECAYELVLKLRVSQSKVFDADTKYCVYIRPHETLYHGLWNVTNTLHLNGPNVSKIFGDRRFDLSKEGFLEHRCHDMAYDYPCKIPAFLNQAQKEAIYSIQMQSPYNPFILFGPPGTGKTTTLVEAVRSIIQYPQEEERPKFLVCTPSNMAADTFGLALIKSKVIDKSRILRMLADRVDFSLVDPQIKEIVHTRAGAPALPCTATLKGYDVVISTIGASTKLIKLCKNHFTHIIIDEAGQATEPETLIPLLLMSHMNCRLILAGDPKQLGPVIVNDVLSKPRFQFDESLLMRLAEKDEYKDDPRLMVQLTDNHRSHEIIVMMASDLVYDGKLVPTYPEGHDSFVDHPLLEGNRFPLRFHSVFGEEAGRESKYNLEEVDTVVMYVEELLKTTPDLLPADIGVVAPYKEQGRRISDALRQYKDLTVDTVEKFQGSERRVIIITTTRTEGLGFVDEIRRFNTAVTRARELLIVIGHPNALMAGSFWKSFLHFCSSNGCFHSNDKRLVLQWQHYFDGTYPEDENDRLEGTNDGFADEPRIYPSDPYADEVDRRRQRIREVDALWQENVEPHYNPRVPSVNNTPVSVETSRNYIYGFPDGDDRVLVPDDDYVIEPYRRNLYPEALSDSDDDFYLGHSSNVYDERNGGNRSTEPHYEGNNTGIALKPILDPRMEAVSPKNANAFPRRVPYVRIYDVHEEYGSYTPPTNAPRTSDSRELIETELSRPDFTDPRSVSDREDRVESMVTHSTSIENNIYRQAHSKFKPSRYELEMRRERRTSVEIADSQVASFRGGDDIRRQESVIDRSEHYDFGIYHQAQQDNPYQYESEVRRDIGPTFGTGEHHVASFRENDDFRREESAPNRSDLYESSIYHHSPSHENYQYEPEVRRDVGPTFDIDESPLASFRESEKFREQESLLNAVPQFYSPNNIFRLAHSKGYRRKAKNHQREVKPKSDIAETCRETIDELRRQISSLCLSDEDESPET